MNARGGEVSFEGLLVSQLKKQVKKDCWNDNGDERKTIQLDGQEMQMSRNTQGEMAHKWQLLSMTIVAKSWLVLLQKNHFVVSQHDLPFRDKVAIKCVGIFSQRYFSLYFTSTKTFLKKHYHVDVFFLEQYNLQSDLKIFLSITI